jgi:YHS domain-containing protein
MYRLLLILGLLIILYFLVRKALREFNKPSLPTQGSAEADHMIQDPVCRTYIPQGNAVSASIGGQTYYFCSMNCAQTFQKQLSG